MKRVLLKPIKYYSLLLVAPIVLIVFAPSCTKEIEYRPSAKFTLRGVVLSAEDTLPLKDILVTMMTDSIKIDTATTDQNGIFIISDTLGIPAEVSYTLKFNKVEDELKSSKGKIDSTMIFQFKDLTFTNGDGQWYLGETIKDSTFMLKSKIE